MFRWIPAQKKNIEPRETVLLMDTTYFWSFWVMVFRVWDNKKRENMFWRRVENETSELYLEWIDYLERQWWKFKAVVCDGILWIRWRVSMPIQMCHFHQKKNIRKYLTKNPVLYPNQALNYLVQRLGKISEREFRDKLQRWYKDNREFLNEKTVNIRWKKQFAHKRTRSAYNSLRRNLPYLFTYTYYDYDIPNTTNSLEWMFGQLKSKVRIHSGLRDDRKYKLIDYILNM